MILATARPSFEHGFGGHSIVTRFALNRLGKDQIGDIVAKLTDGKALPDEIMAVIAQRTDGVPLFVEALTKTILESGALREDGERLVLNGPRSTTAIPTMLHDSLMARLDRLQPVEEVAQTAACIGREFAHGSLAQVSHLPDTELATALDGLIKAQLIYRRGLPLDATYLFKHALVRDAAYESLLKENRRVVHTRISVALEADPDIAPEVLAVHAEAANLTDRAIDLWETASKSAIARPAFDEAISHLGYAIKLITPQLDNGDSSTLNRALSLQVPLGMALLTRRGFGADKTVAAFECAPALADRVGETPMRYSILYGLWASTGIRGRHVEALKTAEALVTLAGKSSDTASLVVANRVAGASHWFMGNFAVSERHLETALSHFDPVEHAGLAHRFGQGVGVTVHNFLALNLLTLGQTQRTLAHAEETERLAKSTGHVQTICYAMVHRSIFGLMAGDLATARHCLPELIPNAQEHNLAHWLIYSSVLTEILAASNGDKSSVQRYETADAAIISVKCTFYLPQMRAHFARSALPIGRPDDAAELAAMARDMINESSETYVLSDLHRLRAAIATAGDETETAGTYLVTAIDVARQQSGKLFELRAAINLASLWRDQGKTAEAISLLKPVHDSIAEGDCPEDRATAQALLTALAGSLGFNLVPSGSPKGAAWTIGGPPPAPRSLDCGWR